jgi:adenylate cyclase
MGKIFNLKFAYWMIGILSGAIIVISFLLGLFSGLEKFLEDTLFSAKKVSSQIVIVTIDDESISKLGQWPWSREIFTKALESLSSKSPKVVGIDIVFSEKSRIGENDDKKLADQLNKTSFPIVLASEAHGIELGSNNIFQAKYFLLPLKQFTESSKIYLSHVNLSVDPDGVVRQFPLKIQLQNSANENTYNSFAYQLSLLSENKINLSDINETNRIAYSSYPGGIRRIPFWRLLEDKSVASELAEKIVLIGATASDLHDEQLTPFSRGIPMSGVEIQANILNMFLNNYRLNDISASLMIILILLVSLLTATIFVFTNGIVKPVLINLILFLIYIVGIILAFDNGWIINIVHIVGIWFLSLIFQIIFRYFLVERNKRELKDIFSKYVSKSVLDEILINPKNIKLGGEEKTTSILFSDIRGFTALSEKMTPTELTNYLNRYLTCMTDIILTERGLIDKYIGDAIMAFWGAPLPNNHHALDAVKSAVAMIQALKVFNEENRKLNEPEIKIGIGINSGIVIAGNMGSRERLSYTLMGDAVNLASRLEGLNKIYGTSIIVSEFVIKSIGEDVLTSNNISFRLIDCVKVKGKNQCIFIYEIISKDQYINLTNILENFNQAFKYYQSGNWAKSLAIIEKILKIESEDGPTNVLKKRCEEFIKNPPKNWSGVFEFTSK